MKGAATILMVVLVAIVSVLTTLGMYFSVTASNVENIRRSIIERGITAEINEVELLKQNLHQALDYSFYQSKYEVAGLGGYVKLTGVPSYNNLPYWRVYTTSYSSPYVKSLSDRTLEIYNIYNNSITTEISKSGATRVSVERTASADYVLVTAFSDKPIKLEKPNLTI